MAWLAAPTDDLTRSHGGWVAGPVIKLSPLTTLTQILSLSLSLSLSSLYHSFALATERVLGTTSLYLAE